MGEMDGEWGKGGWWRWMGSEGRVDGGVRGDGWGVKEGWMGEIDGE